MNNLKNKNLPFHVAVIPDGNRRWAKERGLKPWKGHEKGAEVLEELTIKALEIGIKCISFWGSSQDNLRKRPIQEKRILLKIYEKYFKRLMDDERVYKNEAKINIVGRWEEQFPSGLKRVLKQGMEKTKNHSRHLLNFLLAYNGDDDILEAIKGAIQNKEEDKKIEVNNDLVQKNLLSKSVPAVDLIIRTGTKRDPHNSAGFLMWQTQHSQLFFSDKYLPDFSTDDFEDAIEDYCERERRAGK